MIASLRAVAASPGPMLGWAAMVFILLLVASQPAFLGLFVAVPVLGHATWRRYRKIVVLRRGIAPPLGEPDIKPPPPTGGLAAQLADGEWIRSFDRRDRQLKCNSPECNSPAPPA